LSLKTSSKRLVGAIGRLPFVSTIAWHPLVHGLLAKVPGAHVLHGDGWEKVHPFDRVHGTDTSGRVAVEDLGVNEAARVHASCYGRSQPSILRRALAALPPVDLCTFLDLGCGKGRALLVASELPFREILGVELSTSLAAIARRNAAIIAQRYPRRTAVRIVVADASTFPMPSGDLVLFMYHPFGAELVAKIVEGVEAALAAERRCIYIVYYNPVAGRCFDASTQLTRRFARMLRYAADERGYGPDLEDPIVIWQGGTAPLPNGPADARIVVVRAGGRVVLEEP
jgi:SAM-dependent methyltransferase